MDPNFGKEISASIIKLNNLLDIILVDNITAYSYYSYCDVIMWGNTQ